jgi:hypothetical protein
MRRAISLSMLYFLSIGVMIAAYSFAPVVAG